MGGVEGDEVQHVGDGADQGEEGGDERGKWIEMRGEG